MARYGEFILLKPAVGLHTALLWSSPFLLLVIGGTLAWRVGYRKKSDSKAAKLSEAEHEALDRIIKEHRS